MQDWSAAVSSPDGEQDVYQWRFNARYSQPALWPKPSASVGVSRVRGGQPSTAPPMWQRETQKRRAMESESLAIWTPAGL